MTFGERLKPDSPLLTTGIDYRLKGWSKLSGHGGKFLTTTSISGVSFDPLSRTY